MNLRAHRVVELDAVLTEQIAERTIESHLCLHPIRASRHFGRPRLRKVSLVLDDGVVRTRTHRELVNIGLQ